MFMFLHLVVHNSSKPVRAPFYRELLRKISIERLAIFRVSVTVKSHQSERRYALQFIFFFSRSVQTAWIACMHVLATDDQDIYFALASFTFVRLSYIKYY